MPTPRTHACIMTDCFMWAACTLFPRVFVCSPRCAALICPALCNAHVCAECMPYSKSVYCVYMRPRDSTLALGLNTVFDAALINPRLISSWSWTSLPSTRDPLSNCCEVLRQIRLVPPSPPSSIVHLFIYFFLFPETTTQILSWPIFQCGICFLYLLYHLIFSSKCKLLPLPGSWP